MKIRERATRPAIAGAIVDYDRAVQMLGFGVDLDLLKTEINIVTTKLVPLMVELLTAVASSYSVFNQDDIFAAGDGVHCDLYLDSDGRLSVRSSAAPELQLEVEEFYCEIQRATDQLQKFTPQTGAEVVDGPRVCVDDFSTGLQVYDRSPGNVTSKKTRRQPTEGEKVIIKAINKGLRRDRLCAELDTAKVQPRQSWLHDEMYPWPGTYLKAWSSKGRSGTYWHRKIGTYVQNIKRDFPDRIKITKSPR